MVSFLKGIGYLVSAVSVILLGIVSWKSAAEQPLLALCLIGGMVASILGMGLRWISHRMDQAEKHAAERLPDSASRKDARRHGQFFPE